MIPFGNFSVSHQLSNRKLIFFITIKYTHASWAPPQISILQQPGVFFYTIFYSLFFFQQYVLVKEDELWVWTPFWTPNVYEWFYSARRLSWFWCNGSFSWWIFFSELNQNFFIYEKVAKLIQVIILLTCSCDYLVN